MQLSASPLLSTKLKMPAPRRNYIVRSQLFEQLRRCFEMRVIFIKGAAGMGKTTLLSSFIRETGLENTAWLTLDEANNNLFSFWHYFTEAVGAFLGEDRADILSLIQSDFDGTHMEQMLTLLINRLCGDTEYFIVLDDVHCLDDPALIRSLEFFLKSMPQNLHLFMLSRQDPPVYLGELAASGELLYLDGSNLRFSHEECLRFLKDTLKLSVDDGELEQMSAYAEGWIGGLQLIAAAGGVRRAFVSTSGGAAGTIAADYLTREIFESLTEYEQKFLTATGILSYFDEELCSRLIGINDFSRLVGGLMDKNLFITCIDEDNGIYRYHNILGEYLKQQFSLLPKETQIQLRLKAAQALEARGDNEEALLHLFASEQYEEAMRLIKNMNETIETWAYVDKLPIDYLISDLNLSVQCMMYNFSAMHIARCRELADILEKRYQDDDVIKCLQYLYRFLGNTDNSTIPLDVLTLDQIEKLNLSPVTQSLLLVENSDLLLTYNRYAQSEQFADRALKINNGANLFVDFFALASKAQILEETGRLNDSLAAYEHTESLMNSSAFKVALGYQHYMGLIGVYHRRMDEANSRKTLDAIENILSKDKAVPELIRLNYDYHLSEYEFLFGDPRRGSLVLSKMMAEFYPMSILHVERLISCAHAQHLLKPQAAEQFIKEFEQSNKTITSLSVRLLYAKLIADAGRPDDAAQEIESVLAFCREHKNRLRLVEADLIKIHMAVQSGSAQKRNIENLLREAVYYAYENRILQPFFVEKQTVEPLLDSFIKSADNSLNKGEHRFLQDIRALYTDSKPIEKPTDAKETLSAREREVLGELATGLTNQEIADRLCISLATVKTHILNIYGKLGVSSRVTAIEQAKKQNLL